MIDGTTTLPRRVQPTALQGTFSTGNKFHILLNRWLPPRDYEFLPIIINTDLGPEASKIWQDEENNLGFRYPGLTLALSPHNHSFMVRSACCRSTVTRFEGPRTCLTCEEPVLLGELDEDNRKDADSWPEALTLLVNSFEEPLRAIVVDAELRELVGNWLDWGSAELDWRRARENAHRRLVRIVTQQAQVHRQRAEYYGELVKELEARLPEAQHSAIAEAVASALGPLPEVPSLNDEPSYLVYEGETPAPMAQYREPGRW